MHAGAIADARAAAPGLPLIVADALADDGDAIATWLALGATAASLGAADADAAIARAAHRHLARRRAERAGARARAPALTTFLRRMRGVYFKRRAAALGAHRRAVVAVALLSPEAAPATPRRRAARSRARPRRRPSCRAAGARSSRPSAIVAYYGNPADDQLGILGIGSPALAGRRLLRQAKAYDRPGRPVLPAMELITTVANADPGDDGLYRRQERNAVIRRYLRAARADQGAAGARHPARPRPTSWTRSSACAAGCASPTSASRSTPSGT